MFSSLALGEDELKHQAQQAPWIQLVIIPSPPDPLSCQAGPTSEPSRPASTVKAPETAESLDGLGGVRWDVFVLICLMSVFEGEGKVKAHCQQDITTADPMSD